MTVINLPLLAQPKMRSGQVDESHLANKKYYEKIYPVVWRMFSNGDIDNIALIYEQIMNKA